MQYLSIRYTERLADAGVVKSVGGKGDSYDIALALEENYYRQSATPELVVSQTNESA